MATENLYSAMIQSLQERRASLIAEAESLDRAIETLKSAAMQSGSQLEEVVPVGVRRPSRDVGIYSVIGIRWACLWILSQAGKVGLSTAVIADLLVRGGRTTKAGRFSSSVSAVLSNMKVKGEVEPIGNYWVLTPLGEGALDAIRPRLQILAEEHLKYTEQELEAMSDSKVRELSEANDKDYLAACHFYFGGANEASRQPF